VPDAHRADGPDGMRASRWGFPIITPIFLFPTSARPKTAIGQRHGVVPVIGEVVADLATGRVPSLELSLFDPGRFA